MRNMRLHTCGLAALLLVPALAMGQVTVEYDYTQSDLDFPVPEFGDVQIEAEDLIAFFEYEFGADFESGDIDPANSVYAYNFNPSDINDPNYTGPCLEQWDGFEGVDPVTGEASPIDCFWDGYGSLCGPEQQMLNLTDGSGLFGVILRDFARACAVLRYDFDTPTDIGEIRVWTEDNTRGGRVFMHYDVYVSYDGTLTNMTPLALGVTNGIFGATTNSNFDKSSYTRVADCTGVLAEGVTNVRFVFYPVTYDNSDLFVDPWRGYWHPESQADAEWMTCEDEFPAEYGDVDGRKKPFVTPNLQEIDILAPLPPGLLGDGNGDAVVDGADGPLFMDCVVGPGNGPLATSCFVFDFETKDCDVDMEDAAAMQLALN